MTSMRRIKTNLLLTLAAAAIFALLPANASACSYSVGNPYVGVAHAGGWVSVPIYTQAGCPWTALSSNGWASMSTYRGSGNGTIVFYVAPNPGRYARSTNVGETAWISSNTIGGRSGGSGGYYTRLFNISVTQY
jgi:hypothetical protein